MDQNFVERTPASPKRVPKAIPSSDTSDVLSAKRRARRLVLIGGAATGGLFTLPSRPLLAGGTGCSVSMVASANPSHAMPGTCGNTPGCWKNRSFSFWADGATFFSPPQPVPFTHSTTITSVFPTLNDTQGKVKFTINGNNTFGKEIDASQGITISVTLANGTTIQLLNQGQLANLVAGLLNSFFFGNLYLVPGALSLETTFFNNVFTDAKNNNSSDIATQVNNLFGQNGTISFANSNFSELCPP